jgi:hypothetical protein
MVGSPPTNGKSPLSNSLNTDAFSMANLIKVRNGFLSAEPVDSITTGPNRRRSASVTPSERSSRSRITLVENDPDLASYHGQKIDDSYKITTFYPPKYTWFDHLRGVFCINVAKKKKPIMEEKFVKPNVPDVPEVSQPRFKHPSSISLRTRIGRRKLPMDPPSLRPFNAEEYRQEPRSS